MPYIEQTDRTRALDSPRTPGELNYAITMLLVSYLRRKGLNYTHANDCLGALAGAQLEFYRRVLVDYEDQKCALNGDVYDPPVLVPAAA